MRLGFCLLPFFVMLLVLIPIVLGSQESGSSAYVSCDSASVRLPSGVEISCSSVAGTEPVTGYWILFNRPQYDTAHLYSLSLSPKKIMCFYGATEIIFLNTSSGWIVHDAKTSTPPPLLDRDTEFIDECVRLCQILTESYQRYRALRPAVDECGELINQFVTKMYRLRTFPPPS